MSEGEVKRIVSVGSPDLFGERAINLLKPDGTFVGTVGIYHASTDQVALLQGGALVDPDGITHEQLVAMQDALYEDVRVLMHGLAQSNGNMSE